jgi:glycogen(starch) synthase
LAEEKSGEKKVNADFLFEVSWEVCNKVGGIYTVIKTKIPEMLKRYGTNYLLVGPYFHQRVKGEFEETVAPEHCKAACDELRGMGIVVHYGRWLTEGSPDTILIDFQPFFERSDDIKRRLWDSFKIDSLHAAFDFNEPVVWGWAVGMVIERFSNLNPDKKIAATFHEWLSGAALLYLKSQKARVGTVFVTHATVLGRCLANAGIDIYCHDAEGHCLIETMDFDREAYNRNVYTKHQLEKASAQNADVFATVSEITGMEAERILKRAPDVIVPNGLDISNFPSFDEISIMHRVFRDKIYHFLLFYFFPYYHLDIEDTLIYFTASRYEFHDKGMDVFIKSLGRLNEQLKSEGAMRNIVVFFWVPSGIRGINHEIIENKMLFKDIEDGLKDNAEHVMWRVLSTVVADKPITRDTIFTKEFLADIKKKVIKFKRESKVAPLCTHDLFDPNDPILRSFRECSLTNSEDDRVKVILYPTYLNGADNLLDLTYYEAIQGSHFGVFPSFYEPWGYTPLETGALGVASVSSDLAGFGKHLLNSKSYRDFGIYVLERMDKKEEEVVDSLSQLLYYFANLPKKKRIDAKLEARRLANLGDWDFLGENYIDAHNLAVEKVFGRQ